MKTRALEKYELEKVFNYIKNGGNRNGVRIRANPQIYLICFIQLNTGLRIGDVLSLKVKDIIGGKIDIIEQKTGKHQNRNINEEVIKIIKNYCTRKNISGNDNLFTFSIRWVQKFLQKVAICSEVENFSTHSFRKTYAHIQYINNRYNIELVRRLLNHSSVVVTQKYLGVTDNEVNSASQGFKIIL